MSVTPNHRTRRAARKADTRAAVLAAARACFAEAGYAGTHVAHIARRAGVAHGTFYVHFPNKRAALDALLSELNETMRARLAAALAEPGPTEVRVTAAARGFLDLCLEERWLVSAYAERIAGGVAVEELTGGINPEVRGLLRLVLGTRVPAADLELATHGLLALWLRVALRVVYANEDPGRAARALARMTMGAVAALEEDR